MSKGSNRRPGSGFEENFDAIFGQKKVERGSFVQDPHTGKLVPKSDYQRVDPDAPYVQGDIEAFKSPIDGTIIDDRAKLRRHNAQHGVTNSADYSPEYLHKRRLAREAEMLGTTRQAKQERINLIKQKLHEAGL
jgi:hypothetical protein